MRGPDRPHELDGNALAGAFSEIFSVDMTAAQVTCAGCGSTRRLAENQAFPGGPGAVLRCVGCGDVLARLVRSRDSVWLDFRGAAAMRIPVAGLQVTGLQPSW